MKSMKKLLLCILTLCIGFYGISQEKGEKKTNSLLKDLADNGCKCIDSIETYNIEKKDISNSISNCIDKQTGTYQLISKMRELDLPGKLGTQNSFNININSDKKSDEYKGYYYEMERYLMENCPALKRKIGSSDLENYYSVSKNPKAMKFYSKGVDEVKKENYVKAITYFQKALKTDSLFAFAWDNIGLCNRKLNKYEEAIYAYNKSLDLDALGIMPLQNIAVAYKYNKEFDKAIASYERLRELDKDNPEVYYGIGQTYSLYLKDYEKGLENMCKAYNLYLKQKSPYRVDAEKIITMIYTEMKKLDKVERFNEILKENNISPDFKNDN